MEQKLYDKEFKKTIISLLDSGKSTSALSTEYCVSLSSINRWRRQYSKEKDTGSLSEDEEFNLKVKALEKELKDVKLERDILKKAVSIFSKSDK